MVKNKNIFYQEIRKNAMLVKDEIKKDANIVCILVKAFEALLWLEDITRKEGLLALEEAREDEKIASLVFGEELSRIIHFVVDGMDQENIEDICFKRYYSWSYSGLEGFLYLLYFDVALEIQVGVSHQCMEEGIRSLMPDEVNKEIDKFLTEKDRMEHQRTEDSWEKLYDRKLQVQEISNEYYIIRLVDYCFTVMNDIDLQRLLRDVENWNLVLLMKGLSGAALKKIHDNISERIAIMLLEDMEYMGPVRLVDIADTTSKIFQVMLKLSSINELSIPGNLSDIFEICNMAQDSEKESPILKKRFMGMTNKDIQKVLNTMPRDTLCIAMKGWDSELKRLIFGNLPRPAAGMVRNDLEKIDNTQREIEEANKKIEMVISRLEDCGEIYVRA